MNESKKKDRYEDAKKFVRYSDGAKMYSMGMTKFQEVAKDAKACYKIGQLVLVNTEILDKYLETFHITDAGEKGLTLSAFEWEKDRKTLIYGQVDYMYGEALYKPEMKEGNPIRLYSLDEIMEIFGKLGLRICNSFADFSGKPSSDNDIQLMVYSIRE